jgi:acetyltransferase-like isoleucine patch superfamily enzyme
MSTLSASQTLGLGISYLRTLAGILWKWEARSKGATFAGKVRFEGRPIISVFRGSTMTFGEGISLNSATRSNPLACFQPCVLRTLAPGAELILEDGVGLSGTVVCAGKSIRLGAGTIVGSGAMIVDNDFHAFEEKDGCWRPEYATNAQPILIGRCVFVGARAIILKGVTIGDHAIIGAGAVVTKDVPANHLAAGNPARVIDPSGRMQGLP